MKKLISANSQFKINTPAAVIAKWQPLALEDGDDATTISILDVIDDWYGVSAQRIHNALRSIGDKPVTVLINSPGGDLIEGIAIYNLLKNHSQPVHVKVLSMAASAASVVAMAGDTIEVMTGAQIMIHNTWSFVAGNKNDLREAANYLDKYDTEMKAIYSARTGKSADELQELLDAETFMGGEEAMALGFADKVSDQEPRKEPDAKLVALRAIESSLQASGLSRTDRRELIKQITDGKPSAAVTSKPSAAELQETATLAANLKNILMES